MARRAAGLIISAVVLAALGSAALAAPGWQTFTHPKLGFSLSYPDSWSVTRGPTGVVFMALGPNPAGVQNLRINVNVGYEEIPAGMTLEEYEAQNESGLGLLFSGYQRLRTDKTVAGDSPAVLRYYTWKRNDGVELYQMQLVTVAGTRGYVVTGTTSTASTRLADEAKLLASIVSTFRPR